MKTILVVKTSSLGDVVHNLPALTDIRRAFPDAAIDWMVEEPYAALVRLHPDVRQAIPVALRRWRKRPLHASTWKQLAEWRRGLRSKAYDAIVDTQGLLKSALLASVAQGVRHGFDSASAREPMAARFYHRTHAVDRQLHAVERNRLLVASALGYGLEAAPDYGISRQGGAERSREVVFLHSTSRADKHWPESAWITLGAWLGERGLRILLPWGSPSERERSERMARALPNARVPPALAVEQLALMLSRAEAVVGVDTGLTHLAAAVGVPVAAIFCATDARLTGVYGARRAWNIGSPGQAPQPQDLMRVLSEVIGA
jgi:heptosyltransferase I